MGRLGFGQTAGTAAAKPAAKNMGGFGSVGPVRAATEGMIASASPRKNRSLPARLDSRIVLTL